MHVLLDDIVDHIRNKNAVDKEDAFIIMKNGVKQKRETTQGCKLLCQWKDSSTNNWVALKDMKHSYPVRVVEYAISNRIADEPSFCWWVHNTVKRRDQIIAKVASKYWQKTHKYGIRIPKRVQEAIAIKKENGNTLWWDAICKEMTNVGPTIEKWEGKEGDLGPGYQKIKCHFILVVTRDSVRIALLVAALNKLELLACDIQKAYLMADCPEKIYIIAGPEFGSEEGQALYGLKSRG